VQIHFNTLSVSPEIVLYHTGPSLDSGPLPSLFYFSLSGEESLCLDPYNQPVQFLQGEKIRVFSMNLPGHEKGQAAKDAIQFWADEFTKGEDPIHTFLKKAAIAIEYAIQQELIDPAKMAAAGLSRGAFIAAHLVARDPRFKALLCFAPLTKLHLVREFTPIKDHPLIHSYALEEIAPALGSRAVRLYIGNEDARVGTRSCFDFAMAIVREKKTRASKVDFLMSPSIGHMGHGTSPENFQAGAKWIAQIL
jgi:predicted esterase